MLVVGETLQGRYRIVREIGAGGMGTVYEGENLLIRRRVAIKVLRGEARSNPELCARFEREAQIASQIPSDHITEVLDLGELDSGQRFIVMEYLVGESLSERLERAQRLPPRELLGLVRQVLAALGAAHRAGVIHRDVKPDNVFILNEKAGRRDFVKLLDFGISKVRPSGSEVPLTQSGMFVGTPSYMAPEQVGGGEATPLWDLYAVGVILYRGLTGETPFKSQQLNELVYKVALGSFARPIERVPDLDPALDALVCRAMARFPEQRFQNAEQFISSLDTWLGVRNGEASPSSRPATPLHTPSGVANTARLPTPGAPAPTTRMTTELGIHARRRAAGWLAWTAAAGLLLVAAVGFALWRSGLRAEATGAAVEVLAAQPAPSAAAETVAAAAPAPGPAEGAGAAAETVAAAASAPAAAPLSAPPTRERALGSAANDPAHPARPRAVKDPASAKARPKARARATAPARAGVSAAPAPTQAGSGAPAAEQAAEPATKASSSSAKPRPDWGY